MAKNLPNRRCDGWAKVLHFGKVRGPLGTQMSYIWKPETFNLELIQKWIGKGKKATTSETREKGLRYRLGKNGRFGTAGGKSWVKARPERAQKCRVKPAQSGLGHHSGLSGVLCAVAAVAQARAQEIFGQSLIAKLHGHLNFLIKNFDGSPPVPALQPIASLRVVRGRERCRNFVLVVAHDGEHMLDAVDDNKLTSAGDIDGRDGWNYLKGLYSRLMYHGTFIARDPDAWWRISPETSRAARSGDSSTHNAVEPTCHPMDPDEVIMVFLSNTPAARERRELEVQERASRMESCLEDLDSGVVGLRTKSEPNEVSPNWMYLERTCTARGAAACPTAESVWRLTKLHLYEAPLQFIASAAPSHAKISRIWAEYVPPESRRGMSPGACPERLRTQNKRVRRVTVRPQNGRQPVECGKLKSVERPPRRTRAAGGMHVRQKRTTSSRPADGQQPARTGSGRRPTPDEQRALSAEGRRRAAEQVAGSEKGVFLDVGACGAHGREEWVAAERREDGFGQLAGSSERRAVGDVCVACDVARSGCCLTCPRAASASGAGDGLRQRSARVQDTRGNFKARAVGATPFHPPLPTTPRVAPMSGLGGRAASITSHRLPVIKSGR
ncbi:hypothetical protein GGX14DRAFT_620648 [Mycena pura]|uniref:Uncharacterized protein n=1 Tax=Mycena pura TaxID=153505 RepID=A0AAD6YGJ7_9AGAR|nr:hypothetical protein GGX14DRAFT_620648 [Mycena pura]